MENNKSDLKKYAVIFIGSLLLVYIIVSQSNRETSLLQNRKTTIGKITKLFKGSGKSQSSSISYNYYVEGVLYKGSDPLKGTYPSYVRQSKPIKSSYYTVEYDETNPKVSKIIIGRNPKNPLDLVENGITVIGTVTNTSSISEDYADLYIEYKYANNDYKFRTRLHVNSLPCGELKDCELSKIDLKVCPKYPVLNDLYYNSYDRTSQRNAKNSKR